MGFSAPKPDPKIQAQQDAAAVQARQDKISTIQQGLWSEEQVRWRLYGNKPKPLSPPALTPQQLVQTKFNGRGF